MSLESSGMEEEDENEADDEEDDDEEEMDQDEDDDDDNNDDVVESDHGDDEDKGIGVTLMVEGVVPMNGRYTTGQAPNRICLFLAKMSIYNMHGCSVDLDITQSCGCQIFLPWNFAKD